MPNPGACAIGSHVKKKMDIRNFFKRKITTTEETTNPSKKMGLQPVHQVIPSTSTSSSLDQEDQGPDTTKADESNTLFGIRTILTDKPVQDTQMLLNDDQSDSKDIGNFLNNSSVHKLYHRTMSKMNRQEPLTFKLVDMTEDELYDEIAHIGDDFASIPSDGASDNDSDAEEETGDLQEDMHVDVLENNSGDEIIVSGSDIESPDEWDSDDLVPLATLAQKCKNQRPVSWSNLTSNMKLPADFVSDSGLPRSIQDRETLNPYEAFNLLFTDDILNHIVFQTNLYAEQRYQDTGKPYNKTDITEIKTFLGINLLFGIKKYPSYRDHWSTSADLHDPYISKLMTVHRFGWLLTHIHLNDNSTIPERVSDRYDKLYKVRPLLQFLLENFQSSLQPHEHLAVDEAMIKFKGRSSLKQYLPKKPIKRGYKVWVLADKTGYCWNFEIYTGKVGNETEKNLGARVVKSLTAQVINKNHRIYFDNFFSSVKLMQDLLDLKLFATATVNPNRKDLPKFSPDKSLKRGQYEWHTSDIGVTAVKWRDKRAVHLLSNYHNPTIITEVRRKEKDGTVVQIPCPALLTDYNKNMNFVDKQFLYLKELRESSKNAGNFSDLLKFRIDAGDQTLGNHLFTAAGNSKYTSHRIQNEIISLAGEVLLRSVVEEANSSKYFSVLADETADIAGHEQLSIGIRYVFEQNDKFTLKEEFLGFVKLDRLNADSIASSILQFLEKSGLNLDKLVGQGYDGCSTMSEKVV
ncbi:unnamed protein product [Acanthoscelides obtectus]|uniref:PiggyBac transposable element-derived protein domain-containing protein n=1 Tax=Acanthoscelides obtectus TaxID=200917 RepID=A0A9P0KJ53_ACAOB|nr:unnamed protein product [Acanthoscelides obtectus]CAK1632441.1 PiggyBac transposable element-derived protein 4 [Acanthoscelides obtectus]